MSSTTAQLPVPSTAESGQKLGFTGSAHSAAAAAEGPSPPAILLADQDCEIGRPLARQLMADGYEALYAFSVERARELADLRRPSLGIFGELGGSRASLALLEEVRGAPPALLPVGPVSPWSPGMPVIMLGSRHEDLDLLRAFEAGADDFLPRPPCYAELRLRVRALLRRSLHAAVVRVRAAGLAIDVAAREARLHGIRLDLRRMEFELLVQLAADPGRVCPRQELLSRIWGYRTTCSTRTLDSHASRLRRKLTQLDERRWIVNVRGVGYRLI